jgi:hypothetical protein
MSSRQAGHAVNGVVAENDLVARNELLACRLVQRGFLGAVRREMALSSLPA